MVDSKTALVDSPTVVCETTVDEEEELLSGTSELVSATVVDSRNVLVAASVDDSNRVLVAISAVVWDKEDPKSELEVSIWVDSVASVDPTVDVDKVIGSVFPAKMSEAGGLDGCVVRVGDALGERLKVGSLVLGAALVVGESLNVGLLDGISVRVG